MAEQEKQCRICLDGVEAENELGRLIRPCLCKGSISVSIDDDQLVISPLIFTVCSRQMPEQMAQDVLVGQCILCVSTVSLPVSICKDPNIRIGH